MFRCLYPKSAPVLPIRKRACSSYPPRLQRMLTSRHIVEVMEVGDHEGHVFLAMEHVHGPSWRAVIDRCRQRRQHIPVGYVVEMMQQAADALSYAHNLHGDDGAPLKIVHRDVNPHNVLVTYDGVVQLIDFGIAKSELREQQTETGTIKGKFAYMSPEQSAAEPLDARSDLFALGICLYELVTLQNPFKRSNIVLSLEAIQKTKPKAFAEVRPTAAVLDPVVERMLRKNPDDRFFDCDEVRDALLQLRTDGLLPEPQKPLAEWLRELFSVEILEHERVLRETGVDERDLPPLAPAAAPQPPLSLTETSPTVSRVDGFDDIPPPVADLPNGIDLPESAAARARQPSDGTGPTGALQLRPPKRTNTALLAAGVVVSTAFVVAAVLLAFRLGLDEDAGPIAVAPVAQPAPPVAIIEPPAPPPAPVPTLDVPPEGDGDVDAVVVDPVPVVDASDKPKKPQKLPLPPRKPPTDPKKPDPPPVEVVDIAGKVAITAEGFVVRGSRTVAEGGSTTLIVDDPQAPFKVTIKVKAQAGGGATLSVSTSPWAIVRIDQVGKGKTPLLDMPLAGGKKALISLQNPTGPKMDVSVTFAPTP
jgi:serine/threonine-protein kinase